LQGVALVVVMLVAVLVVEALVDTVVRYQENRREVVLLLRAS
jgi:hypothetical protein